MAVSTRWSARVGRLVTRGAGLLALVASLTVSRTAHAQFGFGAVAFAPTPGVILDGASLNVTPIVSADRRYVRLTMTPYFNTVQGFQTVVVPGAVSGGGNGSFGGLGGLGGGGGGLGGGGGGRAGGFGSVGPGALGPPTVLRNVGTPRQAPAAGPSEDSLGPQAGSAVNDPLAAAYAQATQPPPAAEHGTSVVGESRSSAVRSARSGRSAGVRPAAPRQRTVRQP